ncbi:hypothetical protein J2X11_000063 [Aeromicrobium panaciterrae]|uniref:LPXTG cell wall anchor domain-containing protein n=1 Tax=Aeromicrobium panaciterrae TaxID=363861 RepID=A0ABU1UJ66_9ACTN|nr:hypothetical protein [Aeromicrobium panaciterrae]MDR7085224.1 hypothetical protein [Aeromicrobium panaciterrae]
MKRSSALGIVLTLFGGLMIGGMGAASAHVPSISASCSGVHLGGTNYDDTKANTWTATIGGSTTNGTFGDTLNMTIPVPQGGASTSWSATVQAFDGGFSSTESGTVGPCGTVPIPPQPPATVETKDDVSTPDCETLLVTTTHSARSIPFVYVEATNSWVPGTPGAWAVTGTDSRHVTVEECDAPPEPASLAEVRDVVNTPNCENFTTTTDHQSREGIFAFTEATWAWAQTGWTPWVTTSSDVADATQEECPPPEPPEPAATVTTSDSQKCGDAFKSTITSTSTTNWVLDAATRTWSLGEPVVVNATTKTPVAVEACAVTVGTPLLPDTGGPSWLLALLAALFLVCGVSILRSQQVTPAVSSGAQFTGESASGERHGSAHRRITQVVQRITPSLRRRRRYDSVKYRADE